MAVEFRENAKEKLREGERFDGPVRRMPSGWWGAALGSILALAAFIGWAFLGTVPLVTEGSGIYLQEENEILCFVPADDTAGIKEGMQVVLRECVSGERSGFAYIAVEENLWDTWEELPEYINENERLLEYLTGGEAAVIYRCALEEKMELADGTVLQAQIQKETLHPIELWF